MNNTICKFIVLISFLFMSSWAKILFIVDTDYYTDPIGIQKITRYRDEVIANEGKNVDVIDHENLGGDTRDQCLPLWTILTDEYTQSLGSGDVVEGAVLIGNVAVPLMTYQYWGTQYEDVPVDYYFMDLYKTDVTPPRAYTTDTEAWPFPFSPTILNYDKDRYSGDNVPEIWVSRIYANTLYHYRDQSGVWGNQYFLTENEIIHQYLDRVHNWMTERAQVPPHGMAIGHILLYDTADPEVAKDRLRQYLSLGTLDLSLIRYFAFPDNNPHNWQAQLQVGPSGNINYGAFLGQQLYDPGGPNEQNCIDPYFITDIRGYKWAGLKEHGAHQGNSFYDGHAGNGGFNSVCNVPLWDKKDDGGYNGNYYECLNRNKYDPNGFDGWVEWRFTIPSSGDYTLEMYYEESPINSTASWINVFNGFVDNRLHDFGVNQQGVGGWNWYSIGGTYSFNAGDILRVSLTACGDEQINDRVVADAIRITGPTGQWVVDNDDPDPAFHCNLWWDRFYYSMRDDGGPSKVKFFVTNVCSQNDFINNSDKTGLLYAMGDSGLISLGTSTVNFNSNNNQPFMEALKQGKSFGEAFLDQVNSYRISSTRSFVLIGAGTLKEIAYKPYVDNGGRDLYITWEISTYESYYVRDYAEVRDFSTATATSTFKIKAGSTIRLRPQFHAESGCEMHLQIDPELL